MTVRVSTSNAGQDEAQLLGSEALLQEEAGSAKGEQGGSGAEDGVAGHGGPAETEVEGPLRCKPEGSHLNIMCMPWSALCFQMQYNARSKPIRNLCGSARSLLPMTQKRFYNRDMEQSMLVGGRGGGSVTSPHCLDEDMKDCREIAVRQQQQLSMAARRGVAKVSMTLIPKQDKHCMPSVRDAFRQS